MINYILYKPKYINVKLIRFNKYKIIGRLDYNSKGLLLLSNNIDYINAMESPKNKILRRYAVKINNYYNKILKFNNFILNKYKYNNLSIKICKSKKNLYWLIFKLYEGKNKEIRKILEIYNSKILNLIRLTYGNFILSNLKQGEFIKLNTYIFFKKQILIK